MIFDFQFENTERQVHPNETWHQQPPEFQLRFGHYIEKVNTIKEIYSIVCLRLSHHRRPFVCRTVHVRAWQTEGGRAHRDKARLYKLIKKSIPGITGFGECRWPPLCKTAPGIRGASRRWDQVLRGPGWRSGFKLARLTPGVLAWFNLATLDTWCPSLYMFLYYI